MTQELTHKDVGDVGVYVEDLLDGHFFVDLHSLLLSSGGLPPRMYGGFLVVFAAVRIINGSGLVSVVYRRGDEALEEGVRLVGP